MLLTKLRWVVGEWERAVMLSLQRHQSYRYWFPLCIVCNCLEVVYKLCDTNKQNTIKHYGATKIRLRLLRNRIAQKWYLLDFAFANFAFANMRDFKSSAKEMYLKRWKGHIGNRHLENTSFPYSHTVERNTKSKKD